MIDAVGSNARCGSEVLMVNELSTTSVAAAEECVVALNSICGQTSASVAVSGSSQAARRTGDRLTVRPPVSRGIVLMTLLDDRSVREFGSANGRRGRGLAFRL